MRRLGSFIASSGASFRTMVSSLIGFAANINLGTLRLTPVVLTAAGSMAVGAALAFATIFLNTEVYSRDRTTIKEPVIGPPIRPKPVAGVEPHRQTPAPEFVPGVRHAIFVPDGGSNDASIADYDPTYYLAWELVAEFLLDAGRNDRALEVTNTLLRTAAHTPQILELRERAISNLIGELQVAMQDSNPTEESARSTLTRAGRIEAVGGERPGLWLVQAKAHWLLGDYPSQAAALEGWLRGSPESHPDRTCIESAHSRANLAIVEGRRFSEEIGRSPSPIGRTPGGWRDVHYATALNLPNLIATLLVVDPTACRSRKLSGNGTEYRPRLGNARGLPDDARRILEARGGLSGYTGTLEYTSISPLAIATMANSPEAAVELLKNGASPKRITRAADTRYGGVVPKRIAPISFSLYLNRLEMAELLIDHGASVYGGPLTNAVLRGSHLEMVQLLLASGAFPGHRELYLAAERNYLEIARLLIDHGADVDPYVETPHNPDRRPVWAALRRNHVEMVELLVEHGAKVYAEDLLAALGAGTLEVVEFLIRRGGDIHRHYIPSVPAFPIGNILKIAVAADFPTETVQFLIDLGLDVNAYYGTGGTPLSEAAENENLEMVKFLIDQGAVLTNSKGSGRTALHWAAIWGNRAMVQLLIDHGADPAAKERFGFERRTPADAARQMGHSSLADELDEAARVET